MPFYIVVAWSYRNRYEKRYWICPVLRFLNCFLFLLFGFLIEFLVCENSWVSVFILSFLLSMFEFCYFWVLYILLLCWLCACFVFCLFLLCLTLCMCVSCSVFFYCIWVFCVLFFTLWVRVCVKERERLYLSLCFLLATQSSPNDLSLQHKNPFSWNRNI